MTFQVRVKCLICRKLTEPVINWEENTNAEALNLLHGKFSLALKLELSPKFGEWDFAEEPFPYCESCSQRIQRLGELIDQLKRIEEEISGSLAAVSALVITSDKSDTETSEPVIPPKFAQVKEYLRSLEVKHNYFRSLIIQRFDPSVNVNRCDDNDCNYPGFSEEHKNYEIEPEPICLLTTEPVTEGFPDTVAEEAVFLDMELKVDTASNDTGGVEIEMTQAGQTGTSLSEVATTTLVSNASDKGDNLITTSPSAIVMGKKRKYSKYKEVLYDAASENYLYNGFKFKKLEKGFECCTCGKVLAAPERPNVSKWRNATMHIKTVHMGVLRNCSRRSPRVCEECGKVCNTLQGLYEHRIRTHGPRNFNCGHCQKTFSTKSYLKYHMTKYHCRLNKSRYGCEKSIDANHELESRNPDPEHTGGGAIECLRCGLQFKTLTSLNVHKARMHERTTMSSDEISGAGFGVGNHLERRVKNSHGMGSAGLPEVEPVSVIKLDPEGSE